MPPGSSIRIDSLHCIARHTCLVRPSSSPTSPILNSSKYRHRIRKSPKFKNWIHAKVVHLRKRHTRLIPFASHPGPANNHRQLSSITSGSSDPIVTNPNSSSLSVSDQLTVTDLNPADLSQMQTDFLSSTSPYVSFGFPYYSTKSGTPSNKEDTIESGYSTPLKSHQPNKKTVYEVVV
jgi:hypothetical protein